MGESLMQIPLGQLPCAAIDFESAGAAPGETDCPVQIGIVRFPTLFSEPGECFSSYIACERPVRWSAAKVHGITNETLHQAPAFASLWPDIKRLLTGCMVVGHNPATEVRFLSAFPGHGFSPWLDTLALARKAIPGQDDYSLGAICRLCCLEPEIQALVPGKTWHDALYDAAASMLLLRFLVRELNMGQILPSQLSFAIKQH